VTGLTSGPYTQSASVVVVDLVSDGRDVKVVGHRLLPAPPRIAFACALVVMPVAAICLSWQ
jgi:hypothetical protein